jgi:hypothetical protein
MNLSTCPRCTGPAFDLALTAYGLCNTCEHLVESDRASARTKVHNLCEWEMISPSQRDRLIDAIDDPTKVRTADHKPIIIGNTYWDYDLNTTVVTGITDVSLDHRETDGAAIWWRTTTGMFDRTRLAQRRPS